MSPNIYILNVPLCLSSPEFIEKLSKKTDEKDICIVSSYCSVNDVINTISNNSNYEKICIYGTFPATLISEILQLFPSKITVNHISLPRNANAFELFKSLMEDENGKKYLNSIKFKTVFDDEVKRHIGRCSAKKYQEFEIISDFGIGPINDEKTINNLLDILSK